MSYTYKITVAGTEIEQYYRLPFHASEEQVEGIWLMHVSETNELGERLAETYKDSVEVKDLCKTHSEPAAEQTVTELSQRQVEALLEGSEEP